ncbi:MAG TPA: MAPEG family protein [Rhizomicrobium sp.]
MTPSAIFAPMGVLAGITFFVLLFVPASRFVAQGQAVPQDSATGDIPGGLGNPNFADLLEMPVLFYVVCLMAAIAGRVDDAMLWLAWIYVALRVLHSAVHLTYDNPTHRTALFALSNFAVLAMWVFFFIPPGGL